MLQHCAIFALLSAALLLSLPSLAGAWSEGGHHVIALIAFDQLDDDQQQEPICLLSAHPRYAQDFDPPENVRDVDRWRISRVPIGPARRPTRTGRSRCAGSVT